jgi:hypothetical protein
MIATLSGKEQHGIALLLPVLAQQRERSFRQGDVTVFGALAVADVNHLPGAVDVGDAQIGSFLQTQAAGVDGAETNFVTRQSDVTENLTHLCEAEDDGQLLLRRRTHDAEDGPATVERLFVEESDPADGDGHRVAGVVFDVLEMEEVLPQFFLADQLG